MLSNEQIYNQYKEVIENELHKRKAKWHLTALPSISYEDVCQSIRTHIFKKINQYQIKKGPFSHWVNRVISAQFYNILRNVWGNSCSPCNFCPFNQGDNLCGKFQIKSAECKLYKKWTESKQHAHAIKIPAPLELHSNEVLEIAYESINFEESEKNIHIKMLEILESNLVEQKIYRLLFIEKKTESEVGRLMGYKSAKNGAGFRQIKNVKKKLILLARRITYDQEIDIVYN